jgi:hypothetical protein
MLRKRLVSGVMCLKLGLFIDTLQGNFIYSRVPIMLDSHRELRQLLSASDATALAYEHVSLSTYIYVPTAYFTCVLGASGCIQLYNSNNSIDQNFVKFSFPYANYL